jgi:hypothetical protein
VPVLNNNSNGHNQDATGPIGDCYSSQGASQGRERYILPPYAQRARQQTEQRFEAQSRTDIAV